MVTVAAPAPGGAICLHCGLASGGDAYCCYGCELAAAIAAEAADGHGRTRAALTVSLLLSMTVMMLSLFLFAEDVYGPGGGMGWMRAAYRVAAAVLATPVVALLLPPLAGAALAKARAGRLSMELLVATGAAAAYALSIANVARRSGGVYFDSATAALLLATAGRYLEASARSRASRLIGPSLALAAEPVEVSGDGGASWHRVSPALVDHGARLRVEVEHVVPVDARVERAPVEVNLAVLTGEARPTRVEVGGVVPAGAVPVSGAIECVALRSARESTLERLGSLARSLRDRPPRLLRAADRFAAALVPAVWALAVATFAWWSARAGWSRGTEAALAVVLAACPCTYGVAVPLVLWLALRKALEHGVLVRNAGALEELARVRVVAFDKTGTLTGRDLAVERIDAAAGVRDHALALAAALEQGSPHPIARAIVDRARAEGIEPAPLAERCVEPGRGATGIDAEGRRLLIGASPRPPAEGADSLAPARDRAVLLRDGVVLATFAIQEVVRPEAAAAVAALRAQGVGALVLSGDATERAAAVAGELGIDAEGGLGAREKLDRLRELGAGVAMVGDGWNDAPTLAGVGPSFAMGGGTGLARGVAQVTLVHEDLRLVPWTLGLARRALATARASLVGGLWPATTQPWALQSFRTDELAEPALQRTDNPART